MKTDCVKGFRDIEDAGKRIAIKKIIEETFQLYGFKAVETPIIEYEEFVKGDNPDDEAVSDIFKLQDKGKRKLVLRYEHTFSLKRLMKNKKLPYKRYTIGSVFRDEPITGNRWRQFTQCDADIVGTDLNGVAEILKIISEVLEKLKIKSNINVNNRKLLNEILLDLDVKEKDKEQVLREIDKLDKLSESEVKRNLKKYGAERVLSIFKKPEKYFEKYENYKDIRELKKICNLLGVEVNFQPFLVRGLSYYNWIVFEVRSVSGIKESIMGSGSYLVNGIQATGISFGLDRLELLAKISTLIKKVLLISLGQDEIAFKLADKIRSLNIPCEIFYNKPGKALEYANSLNIPLVVFIGDQEAKKKKFKLKNMNSGKEKLITEKNLLKELEKIN